MTQITLPNTNITGANLWSQVEGNDQAIVTVVNGNITNDNVAAAAAINASKIGHTVSAKTDDYTPVTADRGSVITVNKASAATVTINGSLDLAVGDRIDFIQTGAGEVTFSASGTTVNGAPGLKISGQYRAATLLCVGTDSYILIGSLAA